VRIIAGAHVCPRGVTVPTVRLAGMDRAGLGFVVGLLGTDEGS
jgi:hypothetical protein